MAIDPTSFYTARYMGTPSFRVVSADAMTPGAPLMGRRAIPLNFNWNAYLVAYQQNNISVEFDLQGGNVMGGLLDKIRGVKIDNTDSLVPVIVYFPDTGDVVACPPDTIVQAPVITNAARCWVVAEGLQTGTDAKTNVFLYNFYVPPTSDPQLNIVFPQYIGTPSIQRANSLTPGYSGPALGDQLAQYQIALNAPGAFITQIWSTGPDFIYVTGIEILAMGTNPKFWCAVQGSLSGLLMQFGSDVLPMTIVNNLTVHRTPGNMNLRLNGNEFWQFVVNVVTPAADGLCMFASSFTLNVK